MSERRDRGTNPNHWFKARGFRKESGFTEEERIVKRMRLLDRNIQSYAANILHHDPQKPPGLLQQYEELLTELGLFKPKAPTQAKKSPSKRGPSTRAAAEL